MRAIEEPTFHQKNVGSLGDSSTENRGSLEPYIHVTSIMGVPSPPPRLETSDYIRMKFRRIIVTARCYCRASGPTEVHKHTLLLPRDRKEIIDVISNSCTLLSFPRSSELSQRGEEAKVTASYRDEALTNSNHITNWCQIWGSRLKERHLGDLNNNQILENVTIEHSENLYADGCIGNKFRGLTTFNTGKILRINKKGYLLQFRKNIINEITFSGVQPWFSFLCKGLLWCIQVYFFGLKIT